MEKLFALFAKLSSPRIPVRADLQAHFWTGSILGFLAFLFIGCWALVVVALIALLKEVYDYKHPNHTADFWDWVATVLGGVAGLILGEVLWQVIHK
jgi:VanZ family protein